MNNKIIFVPCNADNVGILDTTAPQGTSQFSTVTLAGLVTGGEKFRGGAVIGSTVYFAPYHANVIGVFDTTADGGRGVFSTISLEGKVSGRGKF